MQPESSLIVHLQELELLLLQSSVRTSEQASLLLDDAFVEFGSSGRAFTKEQILASLRAEVPVQRTATDFSIRMLSPHTVLVTYRACRHSEPPVFTLRSSIWQQQGGAWKMLFHQGTIMSER